MLLLVSWIKKNESSKDNDPLVYVSAAYCPVTEWLPNVTNRYTDGHQPPPPAEEHTGDTVLYQRELFPFFKKTKTQSHNN